MTASGIFGQLILGWLLADLATGAFHWWEDNFGSPDWPIIGPWIIRPNRLHHEAPLHFTRHGFWERNRASIVTASIIVVGLTGMLGPQVWMLSLAVGGGLSNEVHRFAHRPPKGSGQIAVLHVLQQIGLLQSPKEHARHHRPPHNANFCILTDWLNPVLEAVGFWRHLGRAFGRET